MKKTGMKVKRTIAKVPYVRHGVESSKSRGDREWWHRTFDDLDTATERAIVKMLLADKILVNLTGKMCPTCGSGSR